MKRLLVAWVLLGSLAGSAETAPPISAEFHNADLVYALKVIAKQLNRNVVLGAGIDGPVTLSFYGVPADQALREILDQSGHPELEFLLVDNNTLVVGESDGCQEPLQLSWCGSDHSYYLTFGSNGDQAAWKLYSTEKAYEWCGNSWRFQEGGTMPMKRFSRLRAGFQSICWTTDGPPNKTKTPLVFTFQEKPGTWTRGSWEQLRRHPQSVQVLRECLATLNGPSRDLVEADFLADGYESFSQCLSRLWNRPCRKPPARP